MANTYFKMINASTKEKFTESIISGIQQDLVFNAKMMNLDLNDVVKDNTILKNHAELDVNTVLKYYLLKQILKEEPKKAEKVVAKNVYSDTANPTIKKNLIDNKYYKFVNNEYLLAEQIQTVEADGSFVLHKKKNNSLYTIKETYNIENELIALQLLIPNGTEETNNHIVAEALELKQEFVQKFKYSGYSGNSTDVVATILNKIVSPTETGYYMDKYCNFYKWSVRTSSFIKNNKLKTKPALLADYEFTRNRIVVRKEYTGV